MADATPVHVPKKAPKQQAPKPTADEPKEVTQHPTLEPGQSYKLPDGTIVVDH